ncbi:MAG: hypothetical protein P8Y66_03095 [Nitrospirota bacterium]|jgi:hypothetical protein
MAGEEELTVPVRKDICAECAMALRRFIGHEKGVNSVLAGDGKLIVRFDREKIPQDELLRLTRQSIEKLGYTVEE